MAYIIIFISFILVLIASSIRDRGKQDNFDYKFRIDHRGYSRFRSGEHGDFDYKYKIDHRGYRRFRDSDYLVHRYIAEKKIGRRLCNYEVVHHIDGNKLNNNPANLWVCTWQEHEAIHQSNKERYGSWHRPKWSKDSIYVRQ